MVEAVVEWSLDRHPQEGEQRQREKERRIVRGIAGVEPWRLGAGAQLRWWRRGTTAVESPTV